VLKDWSEERAVVTRGPVARWIEQQFYQPLELVRLLRSPSARRGSEVIRSERWVQHNLIREEGRVPALRELPQSAVG
jgi:hypothetical protein